jgi:hypothetical protein
MLAGGDDREELDVLDGFDCQYTLKMLLQKLFSYLDDTHTRSDGLFWEMSLVDEMVCIQP